MAWEGCYHPTQLFSGTARNLSVMSEDSNAGDGVPLSVKIRERVKAARQRFHANDNLSLIHI